MKLTQLWPARFRPANREEARLRRMKRYEPTETTLLGRHVRIVDAPTFLSGRHEIIERGIYDFTAGGDSPRIIDCGANIGLSVIYFKQRYPASRIIAFEADPRIAAVLQHNLNAFGHHDVVVRPEAVWVNQGELEFCLEGGLSGRLPKGAGDAAERTRVPACRLRDVLAQERVDLLKLDIEGAETAVLRDCREFIRKEWIPHLFVEYHSHAEEPQTLHELLALLAAGGYRYHILTAYARKRPFVDRGCLVGMDLQLNVYAY
jgi:FkbM family methyltransferase